MLHCLVFKEQLCLSKLSRFKRLIYCTASLSDCQELFYFSFCLRHLLQQGASNQGVFSCQAGVSRRLVLYYRTRSHLSTAILNFFKKNLHAASDVLRFTMIRKKHRFRDAHLHMAGVAGLEPTHAGFRDPCLTNLAIPLCLQPVAVNKNYYSVSLASWQVFFSVFLKTWYKKRRYPFTGVWLCYNIVDIDL